MKASVKQDNYASIVTSLVNNDILHTEGISADENNMSKTKKPQRESGVGIFIDEKNITVDVYINVIFGYSVSRVSCDLQEKIIKDVTENTDLTVKNVNVIVNNVIFN
jgi:uncharacterized alkaline shock family protein YloU